MRRSISCLLTSSSSVWSSWWGWSQGCSPAVSCICSRISRCCKTATDSHRPGPWRLRRNQNSPRKNWRRRKLWSEMRRLTVGIFSSERCCDGWGGWDGCWTDLWTPRLCLCDISGRKVDGLSWPEIWRCWRWWPAPSYSWLWWRVFPPWSPWSWWRVLWSDIDGPLIQSDMTASSQSG